MSQSRFVLKQIHIRGSGNSELTRYVSKSKLDEEHEGKNARLLFSEHDDQLTFWEARKFLSITGGELRKDEVLHYVLSFKNEKDFESLGRDEDERRNEIAAYLRESLRKALASVGIAEMRWVAGLHRNTRNPHLHILFNKNAIEKETGELIQIARLPASLVAHNRLQPDGSRVFTYGAIINDFAEQVDAGHFVRSRILQYEIAPSSREVLKDKTPSKDITADFEKELSSTSISPTNKQKEQTKEYEKEQAEEQMKEQVQEQVKEQMKEQQRIPATYVHLL